MVDPARRLPGEELVRGFALIAPAPFCSPGAGLSNCPSKGTYRHGRVGRRRRHCRRAVQDRSSPSAGQEVQKVPPPAKRLLIE
jgi:hypothetical protein